MLQYFNISRKGFIGKIEKGRYRWGSKRDLHSFEQHLVLMISVEHRKHDRYVTSDRKMKKFEERTKYCLEFNRGMCKFDRQHEGKINGQLVTKHHICKKNV